MRFRLTNFRGETPPPDPAVIAAIAAVLDASDDDVASDAPSRSFSPWRAASRGVDAFDAYDAARRDRVARRGDGR